ncbi:MAG: hypothetical protein ACM3JB_19555 [Acidobacteriaceae bacterium]
MDFELEKQDAGWAAEFREDCRELSERPASFWASQRANIRARIAQKRRIGSVRVALASTAALLLVASAMLAGGRPAVRPPQSAQSPMVASGLTDQQLLADIYETITDPTPEALAPMELISQDMDRSFQAQSKKEAR